MQTKQRSLLAKSLILHGPKTLYWKEEMLPALRDDAVLIETIAGAMSVGSEIPRYRGDSRESEPLKYPLMTGYESYGRIIAVGKFISQKFLGETVVASYGHRTHAIVPFERVIFAPSRIAPPTALLSILTCDVAKGIRKLHIQPEERVLICGAGAIGLMTVWLLRQYGVQTIHVFEPEAERRQRALNLGATVAARPEEAMMWPAEFSVGLECSSRDVGFGLLQEKAAPEGRICILSDGNIEPLILTRHFHEKELSIIGSSDGWDYQRHASWFWSQVEDDNSLAENVFEMQIHPSRLEKTFAELASGKVKAIKVLVNYGSQE